MIGNGNSWCLMATNHFTKKVEAIPIKITEMMWWKLSNQIRMPSRTTSRHGLRVWRFLTRLNMAHRLSELPMRYSIHQSQLSLYQSDSLCSESEGDQLEDLGVLPNTQTWIHLTSSITNHPPTFHFIIYSYCCCHVVIIC
ncbi:uncharacterized protein ACWYII_007361 [Salvelinus alpinus]